MAYYFFSVGGLSAWVLCWKDFLLAKMKKKKPVIIEYRYIGELPFPSWRVWHKYSSYRDENTAQMAMDNIRKKSVNFEFRVKPKELT